MTSFLVILALTVSIFCIAYWQERRNEKRRKPIHIHTPDKEHYYLVDTRVEDEELARELLNKLNSEGDTR